MSRVPTIKDVAEAAGVSASTASRALAGKGPQYRISESTVEKVRQAARKIQYRASAVARSLRTQRSGLIGVVVPDIANPVFATIIRAVTQAVERNGFGILIADSQDSTSRESKLVAELTSRQVEGLVVCPVGHVVEHLVFASECGVPVVLVDRVFFDVGLPTVVPDQKAGAREAVEALIAAGHTCIGCLQGISGTLPNELRKSGLVEAMADAGLAFDDSLIEGSQFGTDAGAAACATLLRRRPDVTALFAVSNQIAIGALQLMRESGVDVPADVSLVAFDDHPLAPYLTPSLTACDQHEFRMGEVAAELLLAQIATGELPKNAHRVLPVTFRSRDSIAEPRTDRLDVSAISDSIVPDAGALSTNFANGVAS